MGIRVDPVVYIENHRVSCDPDDIATAPIAVRGLKIVWGRSDYADSSSEPASLTMHLVDTTGTWATKIRGGTAIGTKVRIDWQIDNSTSPGTQWGPMTLFRGRVQSAVASPIALQGELDHWQIDLTCADHTADLGNVMLHGEWGHETMSHRAIRIRDLARTVNAEINSVKIWDGFWAAQAAPVEVDRKSALDMLTEMYHGMSYEAWAYDPAARQILQVIRLALDYPVHLAEIDNKTVIPYVGNVTENNYLREGIGLQGCELESDYSIRADPSTTINRVEVKWKNFHDNWSELVEERDQVRPGDARRTLAWDTWLCETNHIHGSTEQGWKRVLEEGSLPRHPGVTIPWTWEFPSRRVINWILSIWENTRPVFLSGSKPFRWLMGDKPTYAPVVSPVGGTLNFDPHKGWRHELTVHWMKQTGNPGPAITWDAIKQNNPGKQLTWGDATGAEYRMGDSVSWYDLQFVPTSGSQIQKYET